MESVGRMVRRTHDNVRGGMLLGFRVQGLFGLGLGSRVQGFLSLTALLRVIPNNGY